MKTRKKNTNKIPKAVYIAAAICLASFIFLAVSLGMESSRVGKFVPPEFDPAAQSGTPEVSEELGWSQVWQQGMDFKAAVCGIVMLENGKADIYFSNLEGGAWLKLRAMDEAGNILGETGLIRPGEYLRSVSLDPVPEDGAPITLKIMAYEPETYYSLGSVLLDTTVTTRGE